jgi:hypothetical protein
MKKEDNFLISVVLPIESTKHKDFETFFSKSVQSVLHQEEPVDELIIVHTDEESLINYLDDFDFSGLTVNRVLNEGDSDFQSQVNLGIKSTKNDLVSILEFDGFLPLVVDVDEKQSFAGFTNEATFAANMNTEIGILTNEVLLNYQNFQSSGLVFKKKIIDSFGGFKQSLKLSFVYEFLLRMTYNSVKFMTIPRIGYKHVNMREGSIFWNYKFGENVITSDEASFWIDTAKKQQFFKEDNKITYEPENT